MKIYVRGINMRPQNGISLVKYSLQFKATLSRWQNLKKSGWLFQVRILSSWFYHNDKTFFQLHCNGIVTFIKTGPVFVGFCCCKMCFCTLAFLKRCLWQCPFKAEHKIIKLTICKNVYVELRFMIVVCLSEESSALPLLSRNWKVRVIFRKRIITIYSVVWAAVIYSKAIRITLDFISSCRKRML